MNPLLSLLLAYPFSCIIMIALFSFVITSHVMANPWTMRFMGNNLAFAVMTFRQRKKWQPLITMLNYIGWLLSFPGKWLHATTHNLLHGRVRNMYYRCSSFQDAYARAKAAGLGKEPLSHPPHKEGQEPHFHLNNHSLIQRNGFRENPHFTYRP